MRFNFSGPFKFERLQEVDDKISEFNNDGCDMFTMVVDVNEEGEDVEGVDGEEGGFPCMGVAQCTRLTIMIFMPRPGLNPILISWSQSRLRS